MATTTVQRATLAIAAAVLVITVLGYLTLASPAAAQTPTNVASQSSGNRARMQSPGFAAGFPAANGWHLRQGGPMMAGVRAFEKQVNISVGQTFTMTSTQGRYVVAGTPSDNGTASGTLTFSVTGKFSEGYTLAIKGGTLSVAGTTYTVSSGTAEMNRGASGLTGQGQTSPTGQFILRAMAHGSFVGSTATVALDLQSGSTEYLVFLAGGVSS